MARAAEEAAGAGALPPMPPPAFGVEVPRDDAHGDFACNLALLLAPQVNLAPRAVAEALRKHLPPGAVPDLDRVEVAGPGFLNFFLTPGWLASAVDEVLAAGAAYGAADVGAGRRVLVEFVSANPTGPLNVVNCRAAAFGDALVRCLRAAGYAAEAEYYVNDAGGQIRRLALSLAARMRQQRGEPAVIPEGGYPGDYLRDIAADYLAERGASVLDEAEDRQVATLGSFAADRILADQQRSLRRFRVQHDHFARESEVRDARGPEEVVAALEAAGHTEWRDGALWMRSSLAGDNDDRVLRKRDGEFTYRVPDIAYHMGKFRRGYDVLVDIYGPDHHGEVPAVRIALEWLGFPIDRLEVLITQIIRIIRDGAPEKVSKRGGTFISMDEFLDEVGVDAARFFFLMRTNDSHMDFDVDLARRQSQDNPVYYVQYAHARIQSILRQAAWEPGHGRGTAPLAHPAEAALCRSLATFPDEVVAAAEGRAPHRLTTYARVLAERFHAFYVQCRVLGEPAAVTQARLALCAAARIVLANTLHLLGVSAPDRM
jgi:arginyl-tRNA synthetase